MATFRSGPTTDVRQRPSSTAHRPSSLLLEGVAGWSVGSASAAGLAWPGVRGLSVVGVEGSRWLEPSAPWLPRRMRGAGAAVPMVLHFGVPAS